MEQSARREEELPEGSWKALSAKKWNVVRHGLAATCALAALLNSARAQTVEGQPIAAQFGEYQVTDEGNGFSFAPNQCNVIGAGINFPAFTTGVPVKVWDPQPGFTEVSTQVTAFVTGSYCAVSLGGLVHPHLASFYLTSGTGGLQEALNNIKLPAGATNNIILNQEWYSLIQPRSAATVIATVQGNNQFGLVDITTNPYTSYSWNGTQYVVASSPGSGVTFPSSTGLLYSTGPTTSRTATSADVTGLINGATIDPANLNGTVYAAGVTGAGIGVAQAPWSASTSYPQCSAVSSGGNNYLAVSANSNVTPGTNPWVWWQVPNANTPTNGDCAFYIAASLVNSMAGAELDLPAGNTNTCIGFMEPTVTTPGNPNVVVRGAGKSASTLTQTCNIVSSGNAVLQQPDSTVPYALASIDWEDFAVNANHLAAAAVNVYGAQQFTIKHLRLENPADGSDHYIEFGHPSAGDHAGAWNYEMDLEDIDTLNSHGPGTGANITASVSGGVPVFTVVSGGALYNPAYSQLILSGTGSNADAPCSNRGNDTINVTNGVITSITTTASGCSSPLYAAVFGGNAVTYCFKFSDASDSKTIMALTPTECNTGVYASNVTSQMSFTKVHPISTMIGIQDLGNNSYYSPQLDTIYHYGIDFEGASNVDNIYDAKFEWSTSLLPGSSDYHFGTITNSPTSAPYAINIFGDSCGNAATFSGYNHFLPSSGTALPSFVHAFESTACNALGSNSNATDTAGNFTAPSLTAADDGVHAGYLSLGGNTTNYSVTANTVGEMGPPVATFTGFAIQWPSVGPSAPSVRCLAALSGAVSQETYCPITGSGGTVVESVSPALTGTPTAPTQIAGDTSTAVATDAFVSAATNLYTLGAATCTGSMTSPGNGYMCVDNFPSTCTVNGTTYTQQIDCADAAALSFIAASPSLNMTLVIQKASYLTNSGLQLIPSGATGSGSVNIIGPGQLATTIYQNAALSTGTISLPLVPGAAQKSPVLTGFSVNSQYNAPYAIAILGNTVDMAIHDVYLTDGTTSAMVIGTYNGINNDGWNPQPSLENIWIGGSTAGSGAAGTVTLSGGVPTITMTAGGSGYITTSNHIVLATLVGYQSGTSNNPCTNMGTTTPTVSGGAITGVTTTATGCSGTVYVQFSNPNNNAYGIDLEFTTDATSCSNLILLDGYIAGLRVMHGNHHCIGVHPENFGLYGIENHSTNAFYGSDLGETSIAEFDNYAQLIVEGGIYYSSIQYAGASLFRNESGAHTYARDIYCQDTQSAEFHTFVTSAGTFDNNAATFPPNNEMHNIQYCGSGSGSTINQTTQAVYAGGGLTASSLSSTGAYSNTVTSGQAGSWCAGASAAACYTGFDSNRGLAGFDGTNALLQGGSGSGVGLASGNGNFGSGYGALLDASGNFGVGTSTSSALGDPWHVTAAGAEINSYVGTASTPGVTITGAPYTGGTGTTTLPQLYMNAGTAPTSFSTGGTELGINAPNGFVGNFLDFHLNGGSSVYYVNNVGTTVSTSAAAEVMNLGNGIGNQAQYIGLANSRTYFGYDAVNAVFQSSTGKGVGLAYNNPTFGSGYGALLDLNGNFGIGTSSSSALSDPWHVTAAGAITDSFAGTASTPGVSITGAPYTGGTATTNFPQLYLNQGTAVTTLSTAGTELGINAPSGFTGHLLNLFVNGGSTRFRVDYQGNTFVAGTETVASNFGLSSNAAPTIANGAGAGTSPGTPTVTGNNNAGVITVVTGTATTASSTLATITFNGTLGTVPQGCGLTPRNAATTGANLFYTTAPTSTTFTIGVGGTAAAASTTYSWSYICL